MNDSFAGAIRMIIFGNDERQAITLTLSDISFEK